MYRKNKMQNGSINVNNSVEGETIENKVSRILNNKEPIRDGAPLIFSERKEGVIPETDIRTDAMEEAAELLSKGVTRHRANRDKKGTIGDQAKDGMKKEGEQGGDTATK